jgi:hypothetical protein
VDKRLASDDASIEITGNGVKLAKDARSHEFHAGLKNVQCNGPDLFITLTARGEPMKRHSPEMARLVHLSVLPIGGNKSAAPTRFMSWLNAKDFTSTFYFNDLRAKAVVLELTFESAEPVWISSLSAHAAPDAMAREFERGAVVANPSLHPVEFDLAALFPGESFRRLAATSDQDVKTNDGSPVSGKIRIGPKDALFLSKP